MKAPPKCPREVYRIMCACWEVDPNKRPTAAAALALLEEVTEDALHVITSGGSMSYHVNPMHPSFSGDARYPSVSVHTRQHNTAPVHPYLNVEPTTQLGRMRATLASSVGNGDEDDDEQESRL